MLTRSYQVFLSFAIILLLSTSLNAKPKRKAAQRNLRQQHLNKAFRADAEATAQLVIDQPGTQVPLVANTTVDILVSSTPIVKALKKANTVQIKTTFSCPNGVTTYVYSPLDVPNKFLVDPDLKGSCDMFSEAIDDPSYAPSVPVTIQAVVPMYYEGEIDNILYTGEVIDVFIRPSDNSTVPVTFQIECAPSGSKVVLEIISNTNNPLKLKADLTGQCVFSTPVVPQNYLPILPFEVTIEPTIKFLEPTQGQVYAAGTPIVAKLVASDGKNPIVTVQLSCEGSFVALQTRPVLSTFTFPPQPKIYGNCILSVDTSEPYYAEDTVDIKIQSSLIFKLPKDGQVIGTGAEYTILVEGSAGDSILTASVVGKCEVGGVFTQTVTLGVPKQVTMELGYTGRCTLTASVTAPFFTEAVTTVFVYQSLTPEEIAKAAQSFYLSGRVFSKTRPYLFNKNGF